MSQYIVRNTIYKEYISNVVFDKKISDKFHIHLGIKVINQRKIINLRILGNKNLSKRDNSREICSLKSLY